MWLILLKQTKLTELENKTPDVSGLATKPALKAVEFKIPDISSLVKKTDYDTQKWVNLKRNLLIIIMKLIIYYNFRLY